jgi:dTDP-4-dehydrorhamnose 3,5-epimerase
MTFEKTDFSGVFIIHKTPFKDERGEFKRTFCANEFSSYDLSNNMVQTNLSISYKENTLRGMHMQLGEFAEDKLIQCIRGSIYDVIIDLRVDSSTFGKYFSIELTETNNKMLLIPKGFAHGFLTLENNSQVIYQVSSYYTPSLEFGLRWNDPYFGIEWPSKDPIISEKDLSWPDFELSKVN